jgi:hypothetical protein
MGRSQRSKVEIHGTLYLSPEGSDWPQLPGGPVGGGEPGPAPTLTSLDPNTAVLGAPNITMHCRGSGFTPESVIVFAGQDEPIVFISPEDITTVITLSLPWGAVTVPVSVRNADGQQTADLDFTFTEEAASSGPILVSLAPSSSPLSPLQDLELICYGPATNVYHADMWVMMDDVRYEYFSWSQAYLTIKIPKADLAVSGVRQVRVVDATGESLPLPFTVEEAAVPVIFGVSPAGVNTGSPDVSPTVTGNKFVSGMTVVKTDGIVRNTVFVSGTSVQFDIPAADLTAAKVMEVRVSNGGADSGDFRTFTVSAVADDEATTTKTTRKRR